MYNKRIIRCSSKTATDYLSIKQPNHKGWRLDYLL